MNRQTLSYADVHSAAQHIGFRWMKQAEAGEIASVFGVPRGGVYPATVVAQFLDLPLAEFPDARSLVVDDLIDSGRTRDRYQDFAFDACYRKTTSPAFEAPAALTLDGWLVFPWEQGTDEENGPTDAVIRLLEHIGEDPHRDGLLDTPKRVVKAYREMTEGYAVDVAALLATVFDERSDEMVVVSGIEFVSLCEHHLLPFVGEATVAYIPDTKVVGLSKIARLVDAFARRLQVQERMTTQIADAMEQHLAPRGVGVVVRARHACMGCRGVRKPGASMTTSALSGFMKDDPMARAEFLALARIQG